jgi:hypothetical protein
MLCKRIQKRTGRWLGNIHLQDPLFLASLLLVLLARRKLILSFLSTHNFESRSDKDLGESLRECSACDKALGESMGEIPVN